jgi:hypothetical protein
LRQPSYRRAHKQNIPPNVTTHFEMNREWNDIKWIFEPDGSLRDIYIQDVSLSVWDEIIVYLNKNFSLTFGDKTKIDKDYVLKYLQQTNQQNACQPLIINLEHIKVHCYFFIPEEIEFDIDPKEINSITDFELIESFMVSISKALGLQVTLTAENSPKFPLFKVDVKNGINKVLTVEEAYRLRKNMTTISIQLKYLITRLKMMLFPKQYEKQIISSANKEHKPTKREKNVW